LSDLPPEASPRRFSEGPGSSVDPLRCVAVFYELHLKIRCLSVLLTFPIDSGPARTPRARTPPENLESRGRLEFLGPTPSLPWQYFDFKRDISSSPFASSDYLTPACLAPPGPPCLIEFHPPSFRGHTSSADTLDFPIRFPSRLRRISRILASSYMLFTERVVFIFSLFRSSLV